MNRVSRVLINIYATAFWLVMAAFVFFIFLGIAYTPPPVWVKVVIYILVGWVPVITEFAIFETIGEIWGRKEF